MHSSDAAHASLGASLRLRDMIELELELELSAQFRVPAAESRDSNQARLPGPGEDHRITGSELDASESRSSSLASA